jgi:GrpB-like predicted nucleotidyltransferase (UPF0157 family)
MSEQSSMGFFVGGKPMPAPIKVELLPNSPSWEQAARTETLRLVQALKGNLLVVHHIGSTAIPGIHAKPIVDLMPVVRSVRRLDEHASVIQQLGYRYWGEYGIPGRRYCTFDEISTGQRKFQLHCFEPESPEIEKHLAFRDFLRANPLKAQEYDEEKRRCRKLHPDDSHAYSAAKADWISSQLPVALDHFRSSG